MRLFVRCQAEPSFVSFRNGPHAVQQTHLVDVRDPAGWEVEAEMQKSVIALGPTEVSAGSVKAIWANRFEVEAEPLLKFGLECLYAHPVDRVFEPCMLAGRSIPEVTLYCDDLLGNTCDLFRCRKADQIGEPRKRGRVPLSRRQATPGGDVEAL
jgi:hypothetical protein